jgi:histidinol phosphatase-like enzyme (inositol monophosphatase family)
MSDLISNILDVAIDAAWQAGKITLEYFQTSAYDVERKADNSPVTVADRRSEERISEIIHKRFPGHGIHGEEFGLRAGDDPITWYLDPIDGTASFIHGVPLYGVMIGVEIEDEMQIGVVHFPALGDMHYAATGRGSFWNSRRIRVTEVDRLQEASVMMTNMRRIMSNESLLAAYRELQDKTKFERTWGDCYGHMLVATGRADIMLDPGLSVWDYAALKPIVEEAGGTITSFTGAPLEHGGSGVSTNGLLHDQVVELLASHLDEPVR